MVGGLEDLTGGFGGLIKLVGRVLVVWLEEEPWTVRFGCLSSRLALVESEPKNDMDADLRIEGARPNSALDLVLAVAEVVFGAVLRMGCGVAALTFRLRGSFGDCIEGRPCCEFRFSARWK